MKKINKILSFILVFIFSLSICSCKDRDKEELHDEYYVEDISSFYNNIKLGFNLGMSFSAHVDDALYEEDTIEKVNKYELTWCDTLTKKELFVTLKNKGFNFIRISIDIYNHINEEDVIDKLWLDRIEEVIEWCVELDLYVVIDIMETYGLKILNQDISVFRENNEVKRFINFWMQVANRFKDIDGHLLFEPFNEILNNENEWASDASYIYNDMNLLYQIFVDTIRSTGGYNKNRNLMLVTYGASAYQSFLENVILPNDISKNHICFDIHYYNPIRFTFNEINLGSTDFIDEWGSRSDKKDMKKSFRNIKKYLSKRLDVPVFIGEFGVVNRAPLEERCEYLEHFAKYATRNNLKLIMFDDAMDFKIIDRSTLTFPHEEMIDSVLKNIK